MPMLARYFSMLPVAKHSFSCVFPPQHVFFNSFGRHVGENHFLNQGNQKCACI